jgi:peptidoglycan/LPS O-acetylase OafA/YrhL
LLVYVPARQTPFDKWATLGNRRTRSRFDWLQRCHLHRLWTKPWALLSVGFRDLREPPVGNRPCLDVLRSLAVSLVLLYHLQGYCRHALLTLKSPFVRFGWSGVDLFFVLSGFLIGRQLWKELKGSGTVEVRRFILRRGFRIWPLYYFLVAFLLAERLFFGLDRPGLWTSAVFLSNYSEFFHVTRTSLGGGWSLCIEEQFYLLIPILFMVGAKFVSPRSLLGLVVVWFFALPLIRHFVLLGLHDPEVQRYSVYYTFHTHSDSLAVGMLISWIMTWKPELFPNNRRMDAVLLLVFLVGFSLWYIVPLTFLYSVVAISYGALTFLLLRVRLPFILRSKAFYIISRLSYGVYLFQGGLLKHVMPYHTHLFGEGFRSYCLAFVLWGAGSLALAFVTFSFIELPFMRLRDRLLAKKRVADVGPRETLACTSPSAS